MSWFRIYTHGSAKELKIVRTVMYDPVIIISYKNIISEHCFHVNCTLSRHTLCPGNSSGRNMQKSSIVATASSKFG